MSYQPNQTSALAVERSRDGRRRRVGGGGGGGGGGGDSSTNSAPSQYPVAVSWSQDGQASQSTNAQYSQQGYEPGRAWEHPNPEAYRVVGNPHLGYTYQPAVTTQAQIYHHVTYATAAPYAGQSYQQMNTNGSPVYHNSNGGLTEAQLQNLNDNQQAVDKLMVWQVEDERNGPWHGFVER